MGRGKTRSTYYEKVERKTLKSGDYVAVYSKVDCITEIIFGYFREDHPAYLWAIISKARIEGEDFVVADETRNIHIPFSSSVYLLTEEEVLRHIVMESL